MILATITTILSAIAACAALITAHDTKREAKINCSRWNYDLQHEEPKIELVAKAFCPGPLGDIHSKYAVFSLIFTNLSKLDIAITRIFLIYHGQTIEFKWQPQVLHHREGKIVETKHLPIHIQAMGAYGGYFVVYDSEKANIDFNELCDNKFEILIHTSRNYNPRYEFDKASLMYDI